MAEDRIQTAQKQRPAGLKTEKKQTGQNLREIRVGFVGNPNCGKTTLFNAFTGANLKVANWPGVTVERVEGHTSYKGRSIKVIDLPGIYSLTSYTIEEIVTRRCIEDGEVDVIINVVDASSLERNLYLTLQLLELKKPVILALNMMDIVEERGMEIDLHRLPEMLGGIPVVPVSARKRTGLDVLMHAVVHHYEEGPQGVVVRYDDALEEKISQIEVILRAKYGEMENMRWHAVKLLEQDPEVMKDHPVDISHIAEKNYEKDIINEKYNYIEEVMDECMMGREEKSASTDRIDSWLTHPVFGVPIFLGIMALVFFLTFGVIGAALSDLLDLGINALTVLTDHALTAANVNEALHSLIIDGIFNGVGSVLSFLPVIVTLFFFLSLLEDSGYMARVAFVMDKLLRKIGLSGRSIVPMLVGFGCTVPGVMASRTLPSERDRKMTILLTPFMSCSAKLPIYSFFAVAFFPKYSTLVMIALYFGGILVGILTALLLKGTLFKGEAVPFVMELPNYRLPGMKNVGQLLWEKAKDFLQRAFTVIFVATIVIWFLQSFDLKLNLVTNSADSMLASVAGLIAPIFRPLGFGDFRISTALITGFMAKESVVATLSVLFGSTEALQAVLTPLSAASLLVFCLLYTPCVAAIASIRRELGRKWAITVVVTQCVLAWLFAFLIRIPFLF